MDYVEPLFRPPSEAHSLLVQATVGCSHNTCRFCAMYAMKRFRVKPLATVLADIDEAAASRKPWRRVFLMDGDALVLKTDHLLAILEHIRRRLPSVERVGVYGDARSIVHKSDDDLRRLREAGLGIVYHGVESGHDEALARLNKGSTAAETIAAGQRFKAAGFLYSTIVLLGAGGVELSGAHARATGELLTAAQPDYVGALMLTVVPGTPLAEDEQAGRFRLPDKFGLLNELRELVAATDLTGARFHANHASNYLPLTARFPEDKPRVLALLDRVIASGDEDLLKPEWLRGL